MQTVHIDVGAILHDSSEGGHRDLVTRSTGRVVRSRIEQRIAEGRPGTVAVLDFSRIGLLDFSCADEVVATLMRQCRGNGPGAAGYLLFAGITDSHLDALEHVLERHRMALVVRFTEAGAVRLVGMVDETDALVWEAVVREQPATVDGVAARTGLPREDAAARLARLDQHRLVIRDGAAFRAPSGAVA